MVIPTLTIAAEFIDHARVMLERDIFNVHPPQIQQTQDTQRYTHEFGFHFNKLLNDDFSYTRIPFYLRVLCNQAVDGFKNMGVAEDVAYDDFQNCIVSVYKPGFRLEPHIDADPAQVATREHPFFFGDAVIGIIIEADSNGSFYLVNSTTRENLCSPDTTRYPLRESKGTAFLLNGDNRAYGHGVSPVQKHRISATFRSVHSPERGLMKPQITQFSLPHPPA